MTEATIPVHFPHFDDSLRGYLSFPGIENLRKSLDLKKLDEGLTELSAVIKESKETAMWKVIVLLVRPKYRRGFDDGEATYYCARLCEEWSNDSKTGILEVQGWIPVSVRSFMRKLLEAMVEACVDSTVPTWRELRAKSANEERNGVIDILFLCPPPIIIKSPSNYKNRYL
ncbi:unnamed protein product [Caenorhabditis nigoni]